MATGAENRKSTQPVREKASHFVCDEPSMRFSLTSFGGFSALARIATTFWVWLPGIPPDCVGPETPEDLPLSGVLVHVGWGSPASKDEEKSPGPANAAGAQSRQTVTSATAPRRTDASDLPQRPITATSPTRSPPRPDHLSPERPHPSSRVSMSAASRRQAPPVPMRTRPGDHGR